MTDILKYGIGILAYQAAFKAWILTVGPTISFWSITPKPLGYLNHNAVLEFLGQFTEDAYYYFSNIVNDLKIEHKACYCLVRGSPLK